MELTVLERINMRQILPKEGDFTQIIIVNDITEKVALTQKDIKYYGIRTENDMIKWNPERANKTKKIDFTKPEIQLLKDRVEKLNSDKKITQENFSLCRKIKDFEFSENGDEEKPTVKVGKSSRKNNKGVS